MFHNNLSFYGEGLLPQIFTAAYSIHSQLPTIAGGCLLYLWTGHAMVTRDPPNMADKFNVDRIYSKCFHKYDADTPTLVIMKMICKIFTIRSKKEILTRLVIDYVTNCAQDSMLIHSYVTQV
jgi:hypothetical protein